MESRKEGLFKTNQGGTAVNSSLRPSASGLYFIKNRFIKRKDNGYETD